MLSTIHLIIGATIGKYFQNIWVVIVLAAVSHYVLDFIPHFSPKEVKGYKKNGFSGSNKKELILKSVEPLLGLVLVAYLIFVINKENAFVMAVGAFFSWLPDGLTFASWKYHINWLGRILPRPGNKLYNRKNDSFLIGVLPQIIVFILCLIYLLR